MNYVEFIKPELMIVVVVLYIIGMALKNMGEDKYIPIILGAVSIILCFLWVVATSKISNGREFAIAVFTSITQGILLAGTTVYGNQIFKQLKVDQTKKGDE